MVQLLRIIAIFLMTLFSGGAIFAAPETGDISAAIEYKASLNRNGGDLKNSTLKQSPSCIYYDTSSVGAVILASSPRQISLVAVNTAISHTTTKRKYRTGAKRFKNRTNRNTFSDRPLGSFVIIDYDNTSLNSLYDCSTPESVLHARSSAMCTMMPRE